MHRVNVLAPRGYHVQPRTFGRAAWPRRVVVWAGVVSTAAPHLLGAAGCQRHDGVGLAATSATSESPLPAPEPQLIAGFRIARPEVTYGVLRGLSSRPLPQSLQVVVPSLLGLNPALSGRFTSGQDWLGALTAEPSGALAWAIGVPVVSGRELIAELSLGSDATLRAQARSGWTELAGGASSLLGPLNLAVAGNYLVVGSSPTSVRSLAPWLTSAPGAAALAPARSEMGVSARLFASGLTLQALHAHLRETWSLARSRLTLSVDGEQARGHLANLEAALNDSLSAYLGAVQGGEAQLSWQGHVLELTADLKAAHLPRGPRDASLCRELAALPSHVAFWAAGADATFATSPPAELAGPDWEQEPGGWQRSLLGGFSTLAASFEGRVQLAPAVASTDGPWLVGWRDRGGAGTALAILYGVPPNALLAQPLTTVAGEGQGRVQTKTREGRTLEWVWTKRGAGLITAFGAGLGDEWDTWTRTPGATGWPNGLSPSACEGLLFAAGSERNTVLSVSRVDTGLHLRGQFDFALLGGVQR